MTTLDGNLINRSLPSLSPSLSLGWLVPIDNSWVKRHCMKSLPQNTTHNPNKSSHLECSSLDRCVKIPRLSCRLSRHSLLALNLCRNFRCPKSQRFGAVCHALWQTLEEPCIPSFTALLASRKEVSYRSVFARSFADCRHELPGKTWE